MLKAMKRKEKKENLLLYFCFFLLLFFRPCENGLFLHTKTIEMEASKRKTVCVQVECAAENVRPKTDIVGV